MCDVPLTLNCGLDGPVLWGLVPIKRSPSSANLSSSNALCTSSTYVTSSDDAIDGSDKLSKPDWNG